MKLWDKIKEKQQLMGGKLVFQQFAKHLQAVQEVIEKNESSANLLPFVTGVRASLMNTVALTYGKALEMQDSVMEKEINQIKEVVELLEPIERKLMDGATDFNEEEKQKLAQAIKVMEAISKGE